MNKEIKRLDLNTPDGAQLNMDALYQIAPSVFTESRDEKTGELKRVVNFDALRQLLGDNAVDESRETYEFRWVGKDAAKAEAARVIDKTLRPVVEDSVDWDTTKNLYIEGDNLEVLKLLQRSYMGKVKMIYIDPPYNTGNDFVYHDDFAMSSDDYDEASGAVDELGNCYTKNSETSGRFHSDWCNMIYSRLIVSRSLMTEDGVIFISIGEQEIDNLKKMCVEIFGSTNYIETYIWESTFRPDNSSKILRRNGEYVLCVSKNLKSISKFIGLKKEKEGLPSLTKSSMKARILTFPANIVKTYLPNGEYKAGARDSYELLDDVVVKDGIILNSFRLNGRMIWGQNNLEREIAQGTEIIIKGEGFVPYTKKAGDSQMSPTKLIPNTVVGDILSANAEMEKLFDKKVFSYPKPVTLIKYLINYIEDKDFIILDFFSGSATTAHATMQLNAEDGGNRKFIMVQLAEDLDENLKMAGDKEKVIISNAIELCDINNKLHLLSEIGKERILRAGKKIKEEHPEVAETLDTGFRVLRLDDSNFNPGVKATPGEYNQQQLDLFANNIKTNRNDLDLLFGSILAWGLQLDLPMETEKVDGCKIYTVNDGDLVACFAEKVTDKVIEAMAEKEPLRVLFRDSCFDSDDKKINLFETFKQKLDWTDDEAFNNIRVI